MQATNTQIEIFKRVSVSGSDNAQLFPLYGCGDYRSVRTLENKGFGKVVSSSKHRYHPANNFFRFEPGFRFNHVTHEIEKI